MTAHSLLSHSGTPPGSSLNSDTASQLLGTDFTTSAAGILTGIWFYSFTGAGQLPAEVGLFTSTGTLVFSDAAPAFSGAAGSGWVKYTCSQAIAAGSYTVTCWNGAGGGSKWYAIASGSWGPVTDGLLSCASNPNRWTEPASSFVRPANAFGAFNIFIDPEVSDSGVTGTAAVAGKKMTAAAAGSEKLAGAAAVAGKKRTVAGAGSERIAGTAAVALGKAQPGGAGAERITGTAAVTMRKAKLSGSGPLIVTGTGAVAMRKMTVTSSGPLLPDWPDVELAIGELLAGLGTTGTDTRPTLRSQLPYLRITRTGGADDGITDTATVSVDVFAADPDQAKQVAGQARQVLIGSSPATQPARSTAYGVVDRVTTSVGPQRIPATDSGNLRMVVASYRVSMRRKAS